MSPLEIAAAVFGAASVFLMAKESLWAWPVGLVNVVLYTFVFQGARLYAQMGLQIVYAVLMVIGFIVWRRGESGAPLVPSFTPPARLAGFLGLGAAGTLVIVALLSRTTNGAQPWWDGGTTAFSLVAQYLQTRKRIESWILWILVDLVCVGLFASQKLGPTAALYGVFTLLAAMGLRDWLRSSRSAGA